MKIVILDEAEQDLVEGFGFYKSQSDIRHPGLPQKSLLDPPSITIVLSPSTRQPMRMC